MPEEDFDVQTLATFLHLTPAQVEKMAGRDQLPARRIGGQWRFSRSEIHHWFEDRIGVGAPVELQEYEKILEDRTDQENLSISSLLVPEAIWIPLAARTRNSVVSRICQSAAEAGLIWDSAKMENAIKSREKLHTTALENGVALLHPRRPQTSNIANAFLGLGVTTSGLPFGGPRGVLTDVFFLIISDSERSHLQTLARLSRLISIPDFVPSLREMDGVNETIQLFRELESQLC